MLNRRSLRIKAAQNLYAYNQCRLANYEIALDELSTAFAPDLNSMEHQDTELLDRQRKIALEQFKKWFKKQKIDEDDQGDDAIQKAILASTTSYHNSVQKDIKFFSKNMVIEAEQVFEHYLLILNLLVEFSDFAAGINLKNPDKFVNQNFAENRVVKAIRTNDEVQGLFIKHDASWKKYRNDVVSWYKDILNKLPEYEEYRKVKKPGLEADLKIVSFVVKNLVFKNETVSTFFEAMDIGWEENKTAIKSMVLKSVKSVDESPEGLEFQVSPLSFNWDDDKAFFERLFKLSIDNNDELEELVAGKSKNWDIHRLAMMDNIILKMAVCEMINFPSIPVKVTINEYIEISKRYSTPKSKQFVNGLLDSLANKLMDEGVIKKSGRGLIDNK